MKVATEHIFNGLTTPITSYNSARTNLGSLLKQYSGSNSEDNYITSPPLIALNINDNALTTMFMPHVYQWSDNIYWIFAITNATAAVTRVISLFEFNSTTNTSVWKGNITLSGTTIAGAKTARALRAFVYKHTTGTVSTSGASTTITGNSTLFSDDRIAVGARIGFGSTDPTQIATWYEISAINSNTSLTINAPVTLSGGTTYVIEEIRIAIGATNATLQNGGIHLIKGLNYGTFSVGGTTIAEATTIDNIRASYLLKDYTPATVTVTIAAPGVFTLNSHGLAVNDSVMFTTTGALPTGLTASTVYYVTSTNYTANTFTVAATVGGTAITTTGTQSGTHTMHSYQTNVNVGITALPEVSKTNHSVYFLNLDAAAYVRVLEFNMRAALTVSGGIAYNAFVMRTGLQGITGTCSQVNNARAATTAHGTGNGISSIYFVTTTRVYRIEVADLTAGSITWLKDSMLEIPPSTANTNAITNTLTTIDYSASIDRFLIGTTVASKLGTYIAKYDSSNPPIDKIFGQVANRLKSTVTPLTAPDALFPAANLTCWTESGYLFAMPNITTTTSNLLYILPIGADGYYGSYSNQRVITPKMATLNANKYYRAYINKTDYVGAFGETRYPTEPVRTYWRTEGIDDNSGSWNLLPIDYDMSDIAPADYIQFMFELDVLGHFCVASKLYGITVVYEDTAYDL